MSDPLEPIDPAIEAALRERARKLSARRRLESEEAAAEEMLVVQVGPLQCAVPLEVLARVTPALEVTPIPGAPEGCAGLAYVEGRILTLVDLGVVLGHPPVDVGGVLLVEVDHEELAFGVSGYLGVKELTRGHFRPPPTTLDVRVKDYLLGVDADGVANLDLHRLASDLLRETQSSTGS